jgi:hypothetical protein
MNKSNSIDHLKNKETWNIEEVLGLLYGPSNPSAIIRGEIHQPMGELLETAANQGRFGMLTTGPDKFYWDMELLQDSQYPDEPLDTITEFTTHYLKFIDWVNDDNVLSKIQLDNNRKEKVSVFIEKLNGERPEIKPTAHIIDNQRLIEEDFWTLTDLRIVLFGETYSSRYAPDLYHKYNSNLEAIMRRIDRVIQDSALVGRHLEVHKISNRPSLIDLKRENEIEQQLKDLGYFGVYDTDESGYKSQRYYHTPDLFKVLTNKQFPIPSRLIKHLEENQYKQSAELLITLKENMWHLVDHDENLPQLAQTENDLENSQEKVKDDPIDEKDYFFKDGDNWFISINGEQASNLRDMIGMNYIEILFTKPRKETHVIELERSIRSFPYKSKYEQKELNPKITKKDMHQKNISPFESATKLTGMNKNTGVGTSEPVITKEQLKVIIARIKSLNEDLKEAIRAADKGKEEEFSGEITKLEDFLNSNTFNGKIKLTTLPEVEKARQNVQKAIKTSIKNIKSKNKAIGEHLECSISTGHFCSYRP